MKELISSGLEALGLTGSVPLMPQKSWRNTAACCWKKTR